MPRVPSCRRREGPAGPEAGFSLMEAIAATVIAVIAVLGLAYAFGLGRSFIDSFEVRRIADARAQGCMEWLGTLSPSDANLVVGAHPQQAFLYNGRAIGTLGWTVTAATDVPPDLPGSMMRQVAITVSWTLGTGADSVTFSRLVMAP